MISKEDVEHIALLARISLTKQETEQFQKELGAILEYFDTVREAQVTRVSPMSHSVPLRNVARKDVARSLARADTKKLVEAAPDTQGNYVKVKPIL